MQIGHSIIKSFCLEEKEKYRPALHEPSLESILEGEFVFATDATIIIKSPASHCERSYIQRKDFPNCPNVINPILTAIKLSISIKQIAALLNECPQGDIYEECRTCNRDGTVICDHCGHEHDCYNCHGSGTTSKVIGKQPRSDVRFIIGSTKFRGDVLKRAVAVFDYLGCDIVTYRNNPGSLISLISHEQIEVLVAGCVTDNEIEEHIIPIKPGMAI